MPNEWVAPVASMLFVLGLFLLLANFAGRWRGNSARAASGTGPVLSVLRSCPVDSRRRLVLVGCDGGVALLMLGGPNDLVVPLSFPGTAASLPGFVPGAATAVEAVP